MTLERAFSYKHLKKVNNDLSLLYKIQSILKDAGYNDISRISQEVLEFFKSGAASEDETFERLLSKEPWEYISGKTEFRGHNFVVNRDVLIPRIETEQIVDIAKEKLSGIKNIVDIGTGSGCIAISLAKELDNTLPIYAIDISKEALDIAQENAKLNHVEERIIFKQNDLLEGLEFESPTLHIANLPYIPTDMYNKLDSSVHDFEPKLALEAGDNGLKYYKELFTQIPEGNNILIIEIEPSTIENITKIKMPTKVIKDFRGFDRFLLFNFS